METKALTVRDEMTLKDTMTLGETLAHSGFFSDTKDAAQAVVKILAGRELGFGPIASMTGVHIIQGKVAIGANLMGASVKADPRYDYRVIVLTDERAEIAFFEGGKELGRSVFTMEDASAAGLGGKDNWKKFPRNMLFSRAMSNGVRWYCPDAFGGSSAYTPDELGAEVDDDGNVIEGQFNNAPASSPQPQPKTAKVAKAAAVAPKGNGHEAAKEVVPAGEMGNLKPPADFTELWGDRRFEQLGYRSREHAINAIGKVHPGRKLGVDLQVDEAWAVLVEYAQSKEAASE